MKRTFGHRHLGFIFKPLLSLTDTGFDYKEQSYTWNDIVSIKSVDPRHDVSALFLSWPRTLVKLNNGIFFIINGRSLEEKGVKNKVGFWSRKSQAYEELLSFFYDNVA